MNEASTSPSATGSVPAYRTGQAAHLLGVSSYYVRQLCEAGLIIGELTAGNQWRIPSAEVKPDVEGGSTANPAIRAAVSGPPPQRVPHRVSGQHDCGV